MKIAWSVKIPKDAKLKVKDGQKVSTGDLIYEYHQSTTRRLPLIGWHALGLSDRKTVLNNILKRELLEGEVLRESGWFSKIVLKSPGGGKCLGVDEFGNIELESEKHESYLSPVSTKRIRIEKGKIIFELEGLEFEADGVNQLKAWGDFSSQILDDLNQVSVDHINKIVVVEDSLETAIKAEAVGVTGLILVNIDRFKEFEDSDIPVVCMDKEQVTKLVKLAGDNSGQVKIWLNATASKVLLVLE